MILVTGGAGFIGSNFVLKWISEEKHPVISLDKLTSTGNFNNLSNLENSQSLHFIRGDIRNRTLVNETLRKYKPLAILHCASENHSERTVSHPEYLIQTNILGTFELLEETLAYWKQLDIKDQQQFKFLYISSNEVYGPATLESQPADETSPIFPFRLSSAAHASVENILRSYYIAHGLPIVIARATNIFGPHQFPDKLIPLTIVGALQGKSPPICRSGLSTRSWLYIHEMYSALRIILSNGEAGEIYNIGQQKTLTNSELIENICRILDELQTDSLYKPHTSLIKYAKDKPWTDHRFPHQDTKIRKLGWQPKEAFEVSLRKTVQWYLHSMPWVENIVSGEYRDWLSGTLVPTTTNHAIN